MRLNKEKGITMVALMITVVVMLLLIGVVVHFGNEAVEIARLEDIKTDMITIRTKAKIIAEQYNFKDIENLVGGPITDAEADKLGIEKSEDIRKLSSEDLKNQGLDTIDGDTYVVDYSLEDTSICEVYYLQGYQGMYSLTQLQGL